MASVLKDNGYMTGMVGKWHMNQGDYYHENVGKITRPDEITQPDRIDLEDPSVIDYLEELYDLRVESMKRCMGFDYVASFYGGNLTDYPQNWKPMLFRHNQDWITEGGLNFLDAASEEDRPFFLYWSTTLMHGPPPRFSIEADRRITPRGLLDRAPDVQPDHNSIYERLDAAGSPREMAPSLWLDDGIGALMRKLKDLGIYDNTAIFFVADEQSPGKASCYDAGANVPYLFSWPREVPGGQICDRLVSNIDFAPTIFDICKTASPEDMHLDGESFLPIVQGKKEKWRDAVFLEIGNMRAVRTKDFKYIAIRRLSDEQWEALPDEVRESQEFRKTYFRHAEGWGRLRGRDGLNPVQKWRAQHAPNAESEDQLYNLQIDPDELVNVADDPRYAEKLDEMKSLLKDWLETMPGPYGEFKE